MRLKRHAARRGHLKRDLSTTPHLDVFTGRNFFMARVDVTASRLCARARVCVCVVFSSLVLQEGVSDSFRYAGLPSVDHSLEVEGLGRFAPQGSYANERNRGGLGDEEEEVGDAFSNHDGWEEVSASTFSFFLF